MTAAWEKPEVQHMLPALLAQEEDFCKEGRDEENLIGRKEARFQRFQRGLNPTQRSLGFLQ